MSRIPIPSAEETPVASLPILDAVEKKLGKVPNSFRTLALAPAALAGLIELGGALGKALDVRTRARIALAVAQVNGCNYCLSAHSFIGLNLAKLPPEEIALARRGRSSEPEADAAVHLAARIAVERGHVTDEDLARAHAAGLSNAQIIEIVGLVAENFFSNLLNNVARPEIDFPVVGAELAEEAA